MDELGRLKIRWALVDDKPERILEILHANTVTNTGYMHHRKYLTCNAEKCQMHTLQSQEILNRPVFALEILKKSEQILNILNIDLKF
jgi:hypothetical protein